LLVGCAGEPAKSPAPEAQSYEQALRVMCDVDARAGVDPAEPLDAEAKRSEYLMEHVKNSDGIYLLTLYRASDPKKQAELVQEAVTATKTAPCPLLVTLRATPAEPAATAPPAVN
jgi:hypothetical protein